MASRPGTGCEHLRGLQPRAVRRRDDRATGAPHSRRCWPGSSPIRTAGCRRCRCCPPTSASVSCVEWNATETAFPLDEPFAASVRGAGRRARRMRSPWSPTSGSLTYRELDAPRRPASRVTSSPPASAATRWWRLLAERSLELLTWILAVFKAGGAYLPLDPRHPADPARHDPVEQRRRPRARRRRAPRGAGGRPRRDAAGARPPALGAAGARALDADACDRCRTAARATSRTSSTPPAPPECPRARWSSRWDGEPPARQDPGPRPHRGRHASRRRPRSASTSRCGSSSRRCSWAAACASSPTRWRTTPSGCSALVAREGISVLEVVPSVLASAFLGERDAPAAVPALAALRWLIVTGEAAPPELCRRWLRALSAHGPHERLRADRVLGRRHPSRHDRAAGRGHDAGADRTADRQHADLRPRRALAPVPIGVPGELYIGGVGVARGYLGDPELTAERVRRRIRSATARTRGSTAPATSRAGARDGTLEFLGRLDHQVKIRGFRIELGEIEAVLARHPGVREVVVVAREDRRGDRVWSPTSRAADDAVDAADLRTFLARWLPDYMVPARVVVLPALPLTPNGKVDRRALPRAAGRRRADGRPPRRARRPRRWSPASGPSVLGVERVGVAGRTSSSSAATRCWPRGRLAPARRPSASSCRSAAVRGADGGRAGRADRRARGAAAPARRRRPLRRSARERRRCRCRSPSSGCGSSISSSRAAGSYNIPARAAAPRAARRRGAGAQPRPRSCGATRRCAPPSPRSTGEPPCRS